jgi:hypothetical protein
MNVAKASVQLASAASDKNEITMSDAVLGIGFTVLLALFIWVASFNIYAACALATLVLVITLTIWICKIKNRQTETVKLLEDILQEIKKQNC